MTDDALLDVLSETAAAVRAALDVLGDWGPAGTRPGQYHSDLVADQSALDVLRGAGLGVLSEETGPHDTGRDVVVALDPVDGSTNASRGIPWFATSLCAVDEQGARVALVVNQANGERFEAVRGAGARLDGVALSASGRVELAEALVLLNGLPAHHYGWRQFRALGAASLDLCAVAAGVLDGFVDCTAGLHGPWDYLGGMLMCEESGAVIGDGRGDELVTLDHRARRMPVAAATPLLFEELLAARRTYRAHGEKRVDETPRA